MKIITPLFPSWVHSLQDYRQMFTLQDNELCFPILDYPASISSFNAEMCELGHKVASADDCYYLSTFDMNRYVNQLIQDSAVNLQDYIDTSQADCEKTLHKMLDSWEQHAQQFLADYPQGKEQGRYISTKNKALPFADGQFRLALCCDLYFRNPQADIALVFKELLRVAHEVRFYPLLNEDGEIAENFGPLMLNLQQINYGVEMREVTGQLAGSANAMLRVWSKECVVE